MITNKQTGLIRKPKEVKKPIDYSGIQSTTNDRIYPSDIDGQLEFGGVFSVWFEFKCKGYPFERVNRGQKRLLKANVDNWSYKPGNKAIALIIEHPNYGEEHDRIMAKDCLVNYIYYEGKWTKYPLTLLGPFLQKLGHKWDCKQLKTFR